MPKVEIGQEDIRIATFKLNPDSAFSLREMPCSTEIGSGTFRTFPLQPCPYWVCAIIGRRANPFLHLAHNPLVGRREGLLHSPVGGTAKYTGRSELSPRFFGLDGPEDHSRWCQFLILRRLPFARTGLRGDRRLPLARATVKSPASKLRRDVTERAVLTNSSAARAAR